ncbi:D-alanine--D-alanine ligase [Fodinicurvata sediminis]|uniref:D-alanine--D-alanine ligase n=1 Tax=Fodinicurvata sediminis TaxID=1121832 RepID=UPI0003B4D84E|nr:D-alanine--D-alanine ligase [Fodinicurvata sediminis]
MTAMKILVLYGGPSVERDVSLVSGQACADALRGLGHEVELFDFTGDVPALVQTLEKRPSVVFNALHGRYGEDGSVQGLLDLMQLPYTHSGRLASALAMDKAVAKKVLESAGLRCPGGSVMARETVLAGDPLPRPYVVKPVCEGSSMGVVIVQPGANDLPFTHADWPFGEEVLVEPYIQGRELTVSVMVDHALAVTELRPRQGFYDYTAKYTEGKTEHILPAPVSSHVYEAAMAQAVAAHKALGCRGVSRADFRYDDQQENETDTGLYLLEVNTQPGMTPLSLVPEQAAHLGIPFNELVQWMVEQASCD